MKYEEESWLQENLRIIISICIVTAIAIGIYNYSGGIKDQQGNPTQANQNISSCESFGDAISLETVPLRCKAYWDERTPPIK